jgi:signal peptidase I
MLGTALLGARRWLRVVVVDGRSMVPAYSDGDRLLAAYGLNWLPVRRGDVVVVCAPDPDWRPGRALDGAHQTLIKRVTAMAGEPRPDGTGLVPTERVYVEGDAPGGYDSRVFGPLPRTEITGRVLGRIASGPHR